MRKPEQIASDIVGERTRGSTATIAEVLEIVRDAIKIDRAQRPDEKRWKVRGDNGEELVMTCTREVAEEVAWGFNSVSGTVTIWDVVEIEEGKEYPDGACEFVSPRGVVCQVRGGHKVHQAWNENGIPTLKMEG